MAQFNLFNNQYYISQVNGLGSHGSHGSPLHDSKYFNLDKFYLARCHREGGCQDDGN